MPMQTKQMWQQWWPSCCFSPIEVAQHSLPWRKWKHCSWIEPSSTQPLKGQILICMLWGSGPTGQKPITFYCLPLPSSSLLPLRCSLHMKYFLQAISVVIQCIWKWFALEWAIESHYLYKRPVSQFLMWTDPVAWISFHSWWYWRLY